MNSIVVIFAQYGWAPAILAFVYFVSQTPGRARKSRMLGSALLGLAIMGVVGGLAGLIYQHPRPYLRGAEALFLTGPESAFPSWPVATTLLFAALVLWRDRRFGFAVAALAAVIAGARVYSGVEDYLDVFGGVVLGLGAGIVAIVVFDRIWRHLYQTTSAKLAAEERADGSAVETIESASASASAKGETIKGEYAKSTPAKTGVNE